MWMSKKCNHYTLALLIGVLFLASPSYAATYYVSTGGSDAHACIPVDGDAFAKGSFAAGLTCLASGDTLVVDDGSYAEGIEVNAIPSGISPTSRTTVMARNRGMVTLTALNADSAIIMVEHKDYILIDGINADASGTATATPGVVVLGGDGATPSNGSTYITYQYGEVTGNIGSGCIGSHGYPSGNSTHITISHVTWHDCGYGSANTTIHGLYVNWADSLIEYSTGYNTDGSCFLLFSSDMAPHHVDNDVVNGNVAHHCGNVALRSGSGTGQIWTNNVGYTSGGVIGGSAGIWVDNTDGGTEYLYNNTLYNNTGKCIHSQEAAGTIVAKNNICRSNSNNVIDGNGGTVTTATNFFTDPVFVNVASGDFRLQLSSTASTGGTDLSATFTTDARDLPRWQWGMGAFLAGPYTYHTATTGSNANTCDQAQSSATPKLTIAAGLSCLLKTDTLYIHAGTYTEGLVYNSWPDGSDDSNHTTVKPYPGDTVTINGAEGNGFVAAISGQYKTLEGPGLIIDAVNATNAVGIYLWGTAPVKANHIILRNMEVKNATGGTSALITAGGDGTDVHHITMSMLHVHGAHGGTPTIHGVYMHMTDSTLEDCEINDIAGYGVQIYSNVAVALSNNTVQRCKIHDVSQDGVSYGGIYAGQTNSDNTRIINTALWNNGGPGSCIQENGTLNTLYLNVTCAGFIAGTGVSGFIREGTSGVDLGSIVKNTIGWNNGPLNIIFGAAFTSDHTICSSGCTSSSDPLFVDESTGNLMLQTGSPAIAAALDLSGSYGFTDDLNNVVRTVPWDLGAYAYNATGTTCSFTVCALFDSYTPGDDLNGLAGGTNFSAAWVFESGGAMTVETAPSLGQGGLAVSSASATANTRYHRLFSSTSSFHVTFQIRTTLSTTPVFNLINFRDSASDSGAFIGFVGTDLLSSNYGTSDHVIASGYSANTWYKMEIAQGTADGGSCTTAQYRIKLAGGSYSSCLALDGAITGIDEVRLLDDETSAHTFWVDGIGFSNATIATLPIIDSLRRRRQ